MAISRTNARQARQRKQLRIYKKLFGKLEAIEWSGQTQGPGNGPMFSGNDGVWYASCILCGGLKEPNNSFIEEAVGHKADCELKDLLNEVIQK